MFDPDLPELQETALALMSALLQHGEGSFTEGELLEIYDQLFDDLTIDDLQWLVVIFASLSVDVTSKWAEAEGVKTGELLRKVALAKAFASLEG